MYTIACSTDAAGFTPQSLSLRTKPLPPTSIQCISNQDILTPTSVGILWNSPNTATSEVDGFAVYYNIDNGPRNDRPLLPASATQDVIAGLFPATEYTIFVATVAGTGAFQERSDPVPLTNGLKCSTETPNPGEIVCLDVTTTSLYFTWGDASGSYGDFISYLVQVTEDQLIRIGTVDVNNRLATFIGLTPGEEYCITVRILLEFSNDVTETDCKRTIPNLPAGVQILTAQTTPVSLTVSITPPSDVYGQFRISYRADGATSFIPHEDISSSMTGPVTSEIPSLDPNTLYTIQVETLSGTGGDEVGSAPRTVDGRTAQIQPRTLYCELVGTSSASVLWGPVSDAQQYILSIVGGQFVQPQQTSIQAGDVLKQSYNNLQPGTEYEICVLVIYNSNQQDLTFCKDIRTCPDDPQDVNIQSGSVTPTTVGLTWLSPSADKLDFYRIQVREPDGSLNPWTNVNVNEPRQFTVNFLQPDTEYCFQVDAVLSRTGKFAEQTNKNPVIRCQATDPVPQDVIIVRDVTNTSQTACEITIQWDDSGQDSGNYYLLFIYPPDQDRPSIQTDFVPTNLQMTTATYPFYNLNPGAEYMIDVIDSNQDVRSTVLRCSEL
ncbi:fibronectin-like [Amphiura filiformis]|uniref:fibronectin-like n=1 Tax=Amphiura filiformis TaxID=82378 RepID=UPI003B21728C